MAEHRIQRSRIPSFFCRYINMLATLNPEDDEARRCQGRHCAVKAAPLEEHDWVEQVMTDEFQAKKIIK